MRYFSMFSGIGGFEIGLQQALNNRLGIQKPTSENIPNGKPDTEIGSVWESACVGYSEIDKYAIKVYERQFNGDNRPDLRNGAEEIQKNSTNIKKRKDRVTSGHHNYGDATKINPSELPDFELLVGGFPCQSFSIAGKRKGFDDTRGTLFFDIARILAEKRPRHLVLENVKGLLSHDSGKTFQTILGVLSDLGYRVEWQVLNSKDFGVPQNRERIYFVGHLRGECSGEVLPITGTNGKDTRIIGQDVAYAIDANYAKGTNTLDKSRRSIVQVKEATVGDSINISIPTSKTRRGRVGKRIANTLQTCDNQATLTSDFRIRRLTPLECERLQGFPDNWTALDQDGQPISDTQRYKMAGNAVTTNVVDAVMTNLIKHMEA